MVEKMSWGYIVKHDGAYVKSIHKGRVRYTLDYTHARGYKSKEKAWDVEWKIIMGKYEEA